MDKKIEIPAFVIENGERAHREYVRKQQREMEMVERHNKFAKVINTIIEVICVVIVLGLLGLGMAYCLNSILGPAWVATPAATKWVVVISILLAVLMAVADAIPVKKIK